MIIMGIDPGTIAMGVAVIEDGQVIYVDTIHAKGDREKRFASIQAELSHLLDEHGPDLVAFEEGFVGKFRNCVEPLAEIRGLIKTLCNLRMIPYVSFSPAECKRAVGISNGRGGKKEAIMRMVSAIYGIDVRSPDAADALAVVTCAANRVKLAELEVAR